MSLLSKRLVIVSGKGGVGKSVVSAALGLAAAGRGRRVLLVEVAAQDRMSRLFGTPVGYRRTPVQPNLDALSIDPQKALEEYLLAQIRVRAVYERLFQNRVFTYFAAATPGLREIVTLGKVADLVDERRDGRPVHDLVVLDAPATGHGLGFLLAPRTFVEVARVGPVRARAESIAELLEDPEATAVVLVTTPEELPVTETLEALAAIERSPVPLAGVIANAVYPPLFDRDELAALAAIDGAGPPLATAAVRSALSRAARTEDHEEQLRRLPGRLAELPFLFEERLDLPAVASLARRLGGV